MCLKIQIKNSKFSDDAKVLNDVSIHGRDDVNLKLDYVTVDGRANLMNNLKIAAVVSEIENEMKDMDSSLEEYKAMSKLISKKNSTKEEFFGKVFECLGKFAGGVLEGILSKLFSNM